MREYKPFFNQSEQNLLSVSYRLSTWSAIRLMAQLSDCFFCCIPGLQVWATQKEQQSLLEMAWEYHEGSKNIGEILKTEE